MLWLSVEINKEIINKYKEIINLHISYLPYNRGAHPNFGRL